MLCKYDNQGNSIWTQTLATSGAQSVTDTLGYTYLGAGNKLYKYDNTGQILWQISCPNNANIKKLVMHPSGGVIVVGFGTKSQILGSVLQRYAPDGTCIWSKHGEFPKSGSSGFAIACDKTGNTYVTGDGNKDPNTGNSGFLAKYDDDGIIQYIKYVPQTPKIIYATNNEVYLAGEFSVNSINISGSTYSCDPQYVNWYLLKMDTSSNVVWHKIIGNTTNIGSIALNENGDLFVGGSYSNFKIDNYNLTTNSGEIFIMKINSLGSIKWIKNSISGATSGVATISDIELDTDDEITFTGTLYGSHNFDNITAFVQSNMDGDLMIGHLSTASIVNTIEESMPSSNFIVFPNPTGSSINIKGNVNADNYDIFIVNLIGQILYSQTFKINNNYNNNLEQFVDLSSLPKGVYFIHIRTDSITEVKKIVKE